MILIIKINKFMKNYFLLLMLLFSLSCYSQDDRIKIDMSINRLQKGLIVEIKNLTDSVFVLLNGNGTTEPILQMSKGNYAFIKVENDGIYKESKAYFPLLPQTGEVWYKKKNKSRTYIFPNEEVIIDLIGISEDFLSKDKLYVKLALPFLKHVVGEKKFTYEFFDIEKWVPVE